MRRTRRIRRTSPLRRSRGTDQAAGKISWWIIAILIANLLLHAIPQEWIIGPPPSPENNYNQEENL